MFRNAVVAAVGRASVQLPALTIAVVLLAVAGASQVNVANAGWAPAGVSDVAQPYYPGSAQLADDRILIAGGMNGFEDILPTVRIYDPRRTSFVTAAPMAQPRYGTTAIALADGRVAVFGGAVNGCALVRRSVEIYDPATDSWSAPIPAPTGAGTGGSGVLLDDGRVLVLDRWCGSSGYLFDPADETFAPLTRAIPTDAGVAKLHDGRVLVAGGCCAVGAARIFDPVGETWTDVAAMHRTRHVQIVPTPLVTLPDGRVFASGGVARDAEIYDPASDSWTLLPVNPLGVQVGTQVVLSDGRVLVLGIYEGAMVFDPADESWTLIGDGPNLPRTGRGFVVDDAVFFITGDRQVIRYSATGPDGDLAPPVVDCDPALGPHETFTHNLTISCTAVDAESGLADPAEAAFAFATDAEPGEARRFSFHREVCDSVGNCGGIGIEVFVDRTGSSEPLTLAFGFSPPAPRHDEWWTVGRVATEVAAIGEEPTSLACSVDGTAKRFPVTRTATELRGLFAVTGEGRHTVGCAATASAGHVASATRAVNIDRRPPARPTASADREPEHSGGGGWYRDAVTVAFADAGDPSLADGSEGSGVDPATLPEPQTFSTSGIFAASGTVADVAGNASAVRTTTVRVDADPPETTLTCPDEPVSLGARATAAWTDADGQSGVAKARGTIALATSALGVHTATRTAVDRVGHSAQAACDYAVVYPFALAGGISPAPLLNAVAPDAVSVTVRYSLGGDRGADSLTQARVQPIACVGGVALGEPENAAPSAPPVYSPTTRRYAYTWQLADDLTSGSCAGLLLDLADGTTKAIRFAR